MKKRFLRIPIRTGIFLLAISLILSACREEETIPPVPVANSEQAGQVATAEKSQPQAARSESAAKGEQKDVEQTVARLEPTEGNEARGEVMFTRTNEGIRVTAQIQGLPPGRHGIHVHEKGDCSAPDASSAGGHYNPDGTPHGAPGNPPDQRHAGDLGNLESGENGTAKYERVDTIIQLSGENSIVGKAVVIHAGEDDFQSQPSGDAGPRMACGVIEAAKK